MFYEGKKVLVAGATGLVGANVVEALLRRGARVKATIHKRPPVVEDSRIQYIGADLVRREDCATAVENVDYVFLCAANTSGARVMVDNPLAHITENLLINSQMLEVACLAKVQRFLFMSSSTVYPVVTYPVKEEEGFVGDPHEAYFGVAWMKRYVEKLAQFYYKRYGMQITLIRPTNVYGPYDKFDFGTSHVLPALIRRAVERQDPFVVWGDGTTVRDFIYVGDLVDALLVALEKCANCDPINLGSGQPLTIRESVDLILHLTGYRNANVLFDASQPTTIPTRLVDLTKARTLLAFQPKVPFEEGLRKTIDWYVRAPAVASLSGLGNSKANAP
jgi:GDP-L-fucose synthase